ncbi:hypothetical protein [Chelatococcus reniformis]|uniref:ASCH domain-containing protein n=1 Tax=Chelatococcus reniformis TaxID=1494448 RepID=A0A916XFX0_9HYPH|nr:hypothetical protein [Chelatococcus reniformis]GGC70410.1 hypothetical protein GCM10010994_31170 [Chelatococcus reniformis]
MTDIPILFSAPMVRAMLDGRKTQTRRLLGSSPDIFYVDGEPAPVTVVHVDGERLPRIAIGRVLTKHELRFAVGMRLWVREAWRLPATCDEYSPVRFVAGLAERGCHGPSGFVRFEADARNAWGEPYGLEVPMGRLRASMHLPRSLTRLTLVVTDVRVQRLQDISEADAIAEGLTRLPATGRWVVNRGDQYFGGASFDPRVTYAELWDSINGPGSWASNPWVVAISFAVHRCNIDAMEAAHG